MKNSLTAPLVGEPARVSTSTSFTMPATQAKWSTCCSMVVPRLHDAGIGRRDVDLAELREQLRVVGAEDLHQPAALVGNDAQRLRLDALDARRLRRRRRVLRRFVYRHCVTI